MPQIIADNKPITFQLNAKTPPESIPTWFSSDPNVLALSQSADGMACIGTPVSDGHVTLTVKAYRLIASGDFQVSPPQVVANPIAATAYVTPDPSIPLFRDGENFTDIRQGGIEDCWLMASLAEVAEKAPAIITSMFADNGDGTYTVRYYTNSFPNAQNGTVAYITIDNKLPTGYADFSQELWVALAEKAYAATAGNGNYDRLNLGFPVNALGWITGNIWEKYIATDALADFEAAYNAGDFICFDTSSTPTNPAIVHDHAYSLISYDSGKQTLDIYNPWGSSISIPWTDVAINFKSIQAVTFAGAQRTGRKVMVVTAQMPQLKIEAQ
jgi:Calpain family cysteine protease